MGLGHSDNRSIWRFSSGRLNEHLDDLAVEAPLEIRLHYWHLGLPKAQRIAVTMRTPGADKALATGFLFSEGIITAHADISHVERLSPNILQVHLQKHCTFDPALIQRNFYTTSSCGVCGKASIEGVQSETAFLPWSSKASLRPAAIAQAIDTMQAKSPLFQRSGGSHAVGLFDTEGNLLHLQEDVGRHNAMDKVVGLATTPPYAQHFALLSGRASFEMVQKAAKIGLPIIVAIGAPSSLAVELADDHGITLIGFSKGQSFNVYTHPQRVDLSE